MSTEAERDPAPSLQHVAHDNDWIPCVRGRSRRPPSIKRPGSSAVFLVVTPTKLHAFNYGFKGRSYKLKKEAAVWERAGLRISTERKMNLTMLTIESPAEGEKATLAPGGVADDPLTRAVIEELQRGNGQA